MKNIYSYAKLILMQKKGSHMVHDDIREEYLQSSIIQWLQHLPLKCGFAIYHSVL